MSGFEKESLAAEAKIKAERETQKSPKPVKSYFQGRSERPLPLRLREEVQAVLQRGDGEHTRCR
jgi:hypothetical protein